MLINFSHLLIWKDAVKHRSDQHLRLVGVLVLGQRESPGPHLVLGKQLSQNGKGLWATKGFAPCFCRQSDPTALCTRHVHSSFTKWPPRSLEPTAAASGGGVVHTALQRLSYVIAKAENDAQLSKGSPMLTGDRSLFLWVHINYTDFLSCA